MKRSNKKINFIEFLYYHKTCYFFENNEEKRKLHEYILKKIENKEIDKKNFKKYLNENYIKDEKLRYDYENSPCGTHNYIMENKNEN